MIRHLRVTTAALALATMCAATAAAHEIGTTRVTVLFPTADSYRVDIQTDGPSLLEKLETVAGLPSTQRMPQAAVFAALQDVFRDRVAIAFDGHVSRPDVQAIFTPPADPTAAPVAHLTLSGEVPAGAHQLSWQYGWTFASYALVLRRADGASETQWIEGGDGSAPLSLTAALPTASPLATFVQYLRLGFTHIFPNGVDHILFVLGLFLLSTNWRTLLWQVSAFTTAHTITLGLAMTGLIAVRPSIVEPLIAVSIAYVAVENVLSAQLRPSRVALVFVFGLLHGLGFAGVLDELGLPHREFAPALIGFNLGVEGGQVFVIAAASLAVGWWRAAPYYRQRVVVPASVAIACVAVYWTIQRLGY
jgi:hypothetical protein